MDSHEKLSHTKSRCKLTVYQKVRRMSEKCTRLLGRHSAMRVGTLIGAAQTSRFERLQS